MNRKVILAMTVASMLAGCGSNSSGNSDKNATRTEIMIQGMKPDDYYNQFISKVTGTCEKQDVYFHYTSVRSFVIGKNESGRDIRAELEIYMRSDRTYSATYSELDIYEYTDLGYKYNVSHEEKLAGTWSVQETKIVFSDLGEGTSLRYNDVPAFDLRLARDIHTPGLKDKSSMAWQVMSSAGEQSYNEYCGIRN